MMLELYGWDYLVVAVCGDNRLAAWQGAWVNGWRDVRQGALAAASIRGAGHRRDMSQRKLRVQSETIAIRQAR